MATRTPSATLEEARRRGEPLHWRERLRLGLPPFPVAGGTNVTSNLTGSGLAHVDGLFQLTTPTPAKDWVDLSDGGHGAQFVPVRISFGHDRPMGAGYADPFRGRGYLHMGLPMRGGSVGVNKLPDGTEVLQLYAPASWRDPIAWGEETPPAPPVSETAIQRWEARAIVAADHAVPAGADNFNRADNNSLGAPWVEGETSADIVRVLSNELNLRSLASDGNGGFAYWNDPAIGSAQFSYADFVNTLHSSSGPAVRIQAASTPTSFTGYLLVVLFISSTIYSVQIYECVNANLTLAALPGATLIGEKTVLGTVSPVNARLRAHAGYLAADIDGAEVVRGIGPSSDKFDRADSNSLGGPWVEVESDARTLRTLANKLRADVFDVGVGAFYRGYARFGVATPDQFSQLVFRAKAGTSDGSKTGPCVRASGTTASATLYALLYGGNTNHIEIRRFVAQPLDGFGTQIGPTFTVTLVDGDVLKLDVVGTTLKAYVNGVERISVADALIASGDPGAVVNNTFGANPGLNFNMDWDDWEGSGPLAIAGGKPGAAVFPGGGLNERWDNWLGGPLTSVQPWESLLPLAAQAAQPWEALLRAARELPQNWEALALAARALAQNWESAGAAAAQAAQPWESLLPLAASGAQPWEAGGRAAASNAQSWEAMAAAAAQAAMAWEGLKGEAALAGQFWEAFGRASASAAQFWEAISAGPPAPPPSADAASAQFAQAARIAGQLAARDRHRADRRRMH